MRRLPPKRQGACAAPAGETNLGLPEWGSVFGDTVVAAILDRLMHNAVVFNISGPVGASKGHNSGQIATIRPEPTRTR